MTRAMAAMGAAVEPNAPTIGRESLWPVAMYASKMADKGRRSEQDPGAGVRPGLDEICQDSASKNPADAMAAPEPVARSRARGLRLRFSSWRRWRRRRRSAL